LLKTDPELEWQVRFRARIEMYLPGLCGKSCAASPYNTAKLSQDSTSFNLVNTKHFQESKNAAR